MTVRFIMNKIKNKINITYFTKFHWLGKNLVKFRVFFDKTRVQIPCGGVELRENLTSDIKFDNRLRTDPITDF